MTLPPRNPHASPAEVARFGRFLSALEAEGLSPATRACYASDWINVSEQAREATGRAFRIDRYGAGEFEGYRAREAGRGVAPATLNRRLAFLRRYAAFAGGMADDLARVPYQRVPRPATRALSAEEVERLRRAAAALGPREHALVALLLGTGLRAGEAVAIREGDLEGPADGPAAVRVAGDRPKTVVLPPRAASALAALRADGADPGRPVLREADGRPLTEARAARLVGRAARAAGVEATPRTLRHTFAVRYLQEHGDDLVGLAEALGQQSLVAARAYRDEAIADGPTARVLRWSRIPEERLSPRVLRRVFQGARIEAVRYVYRPGAEFPEHRHPEEQVTFVLSGRIEFRCGGRVLRAGPGDLVHVPPDVPHSARVVGARPVLSLNVFSPVRKVLPHVRSA